MLRKLMEATVACLHAAPEKDRLESARALYDVKEKYPVTYRYIQRVKYVRTIVEAIEETEEWMYLCIREGEASATAKSQQLYHPNCM